MTVSGTSRGTIQKENAGLELQAATRNACTFPSAYTSWASSAKDSTAFKVAHKYDPQSVGTLSPKPHTFIEKLLRFAH